MCLAAASQLPLHALARLHACALRSKLAHGGCGLQVGPPSGILKGRTPDQWTARQVAEQVRSQRGR